MFICLSDLSLPALDAPTPLPNELSYESTEEIEGKWLAVIYLNM
jgi:hypothetical protein